MARGMQPRTAMILTVAAMYVEETQTGMLLARVSNQGFGNIKGQWCTRDVINLNYFTRAS